MWPRAQQKNCKFPEKSLQNLVSERSAKVTKYCCKDQADEADICQQEVDRDFVKSISEALPPPLGWKPGQQSGGGGSHAVTEDREVKWNLEADVCSSEGGSA